MAKKTAWDSGQAVEEIVEPVVAAPVSKRKRRAPNKKIGKRAYYMAYKAVMRGIPADIKRKVLDPNDNGPESRAFVKSVIVLAEK